MRIELDHRYGIPFEPLIKHVRMNKTEQATLARAAGILDRYRQLCRTIDPDFETRDEDTDLALAEHGCRDWSQPGAEIS